MQYFEGKFTVHCRWGYGVLLAALALASALLAAALLAAALLAAALLAAALLATALLAAALLAAGVTVAGAATTRVAVVAPILVQSGVVVSLLLLLLLLLLRLPRRLPAVCGPTTLRATESRRLQLLRCFEGLALREHRLRNQRLVVQRFAVRAVEELLSLVSLLLRPSRQFEDDRPKIRCHIHRNVNSRD